MSADELDTARRHLNDLMGYLDWVDGTLSASLRPGSVRAMAWKALDALNSAGRAAGGVQPAPGAEQWCAGHNDGTAHLFNGHMTCHECGAVNWKACYHAVADSVQDDEVSAGSGSTDGAGTPGAEVDTVLHHVFEPAERWSPNVGDEPLCRRCNLPADSVIHPGIYPGGGLAFTELRPVRQVLADLANDAQDIGTYDGRLHVCPYGCECPEHNPARDPSCGLCHPHTATTRCAGDEEHLEDGIQG